MSALRRRAVDVAFCAPIVFRQRRGRSGPVIVRDPALYPRDQIDRLIDPAFRYVIRIPKLPRRAVPQQLHLVRDVVAEFATLRVEMHAHHVHRMAAAFHWLSSQGM